MYMHKKWGILALLGFIVIIPLLACGDFAETAPYMNLPPAPSPTSTIATIGQKVVLDDYGLEVTLVGVKTTNVDVVGNKPAPGNKILVFTINNKNTRGVMTESDTPMYRLFDDHGKECKEADGIPSDFPLHDGATADAGKTLQLIARFEVKGSQKHFKLEYFFSYSPPKEGDIIWNISL